MNKEQNECFSNDSSALMNLNELLTINMKFLALKIVWTRAVSSRDILLQVRINRTVLLFRITIGPDEYRAYWMMSALLVFIFVALFQ